MKNIVKLTAISAAIMIAGMVQSKAATTNTVQDITVALKIYSQGTPTVVKTVTNDVVTITKVETKDFIGFLSTNVFTHPKLVLVIKNNGTTNSVMAFEIRDGTNAPVTITGISGSNQYKVDDTLSRTNGIVSGKTYSIFTLSATNAAGTAIYNLTGFATDKHASVKFGSEILSVDTTGADLSGTYTSNAVTAAVNGSASVGGFTTSPIQ